MGLLHRTAQIAEEFLATLGDRRVAASLTFEDLLASLDAPLPEQGEDAEDVLDALAALEPGMVATAGPRYFGFVTGGRDHAAAMSATAEYLLASDDGLTKTPEMSRRGRQVPVYAALRHLGRSGLADLVERNCAQASRLADAMARVEGAEVLNDVVLNQVLLRFDGDDERTARVIEELQAGGEAWLGGTAWHGMTAARIAFSNWSTTDEDVDRLATALQEALAAARTGSPVR